MSGLSTSERAWFPGLDGLRAVAVLAVLGYHAGVQLLPGGFLGVDVFLVLSGYLITGLLLTEHARDGRIAYGDFLRRRFRRLLPALYALLVGVVVTAVLLDDRGQLDGLGADVAAALAYVSNWWEISSGGSYFAAFGPPPVLRHLWSLAIEEQFYLAWPLVVAAALAGRGGPRRLATVAGGLAVASAVAMVVLLPAGDPSRVYLGTDTRAQALLVGAAGAALAHGRTLPRRTGLAGGGALAVLLAAFVVVDGQDRWMYRGGFTAVALLSLVVVAAATTDGRLARAFAVAPLRAIGRRSYGLYLVHWPVMVWLDATRTGLDGLPLVAVQVAVSFALTEVSYRLVETPLRAPRPGRGLAVAGAAVAVSVLVAAVVADRRTPPLFDVGGGESVAAATAGALPPPPTRPVEVAPDPAPASEPVPAAPPLLLVVGDSVAATLAGGFADLAAISAESGVRAPFRVVNGAMLGCSLLTEGLLRMRGELADRPSRCPEWRGAWADAVAATDPDVVVVLAGAWDVHDRDLGGGWISPTDVAFAAAYRPLWDEALAILGATGARVVVLGTPCMVAAPWDTAGADAPEYDPARSAALREVQHAAADAGGAAFVDLADPLCGERATDTALRPDGVHLSPEGAVELATLLAPDVLGP